MGIGLIHRPRKTFRFPCTPGFPNAGFFISKKCEIMKAYRVTFTFGGCITVDATSEEDAIEQVESMDNDELWEACQDGFEIQDAEEDEE